MSTASSARRLVLGTAGHIDHGKSTLVEALTGTDPDRLAEEKRRGITIELGFAKLPLPDGTTLGVVDVPGHERFVKHMIAGASGIDLALLCIAADDGIMPQTREHLIVLETLGVNSLVVALTKCDLVDEEWLELIKEEVLAELLDGPYANSEIVAVSARTGEGIDELKRVLADRASTLTSLEGRGAVRLPIDRSFTIKGAGTVITGTLWKGSIAVDDELEIIPSHKRVRVRGIQVHGEEVARSEAGMRTALNIANVSADEVKPGDFLATPQTMETSDRFNALFTYLPLPGAEKPLASGARIHVSHGTREVVGRLLLMDGRESLSPRETRYAQVRLEESLALSRGDRFVARSFSPAHVIGGGLVLNARPRRRTNLKESDRALLDAQKSNDDAEICRAIVNARPTPTEKNLLARTADVDVSLVDSLVMGPAPEKNCPYRRLTTKSHTYYTTNAALRTHIMTFDNLLLRFHASEPESVGISKGALHARYPLTMDQDCFDALIAEASNQGKIVFFEGLASHPKAASGAKALEEKTASDLLELLCSYEAAPPPLDELFKQADLDASRGNRAISLLEKKGKAQRITKTLCFSQDALDVLWSGAESLLSKQGSATAAELKEAMGTSRKYAIPLLEHFDALKMTIREGNLRSLPKKRL